MFLQQRMMICPDFSFTQINVHASGVGDSVIEAEFFSDIVDFRKFL